MLVLFFHGLGQAMTGDLFVQLLDASTWTFDKGKYTKQVARVFDDKVER